MNALIAADRRKRARLRHRELAGPQERLHRRHTRRLETALRPYSRQAVRPGVRSVTPDPARHRSLHGVRWRQGSTEDPARQGHLDRRCAPAGGRLSRRGMVAVSPAWGWLARLAEIPAPGEGYWFRRHDLDRARGFRLRLAAEGPERAHGGREEGPLLPPGSARCCIVLRNRASLCEQAEPSCLTWTMASPGICRAGNRCPLGRRPVLIEPCRNVADGQEVDDDVARGTGMK